MVADEEENQRAVAMCENCETAHAVRLGPDGEIRPIGSGRGPACSCEDGDLRLMSNDASVLEDVDG